MYESQLLASERYSSPLSGPFPTLTMNCTLRSLPTASLVLGIAARLELRISTSTLCAMSARPDWQPGCSTFLVAVFQRVLALLPQLALHAYGRLGNLKTHSSRWQAFPIRKLLLWLCSKRTAWVSKDRQRRNVKQLPPTRCGAQRPTITPSAPCCCSSDESECEGRVA
eukprot:5963556-Prymnesium_polylepis.1